MKAQMKPLPVRFDINVMDRCKGMINESLFNSMNSSEVARNAMDIGLREMKSMAIQFSEVNAGDSHLQEDLLK